MSGPGHDALLRPEEWKQLAVYHQRGASAHEEALQALEAGHIIRVSYLDQRQRRSITMSLSRGARSRGFRLMWRDGPDQTRAFRRSDPPL